VAEKTTMKKLFFQKGELVAAFVRAAADMSDNQGVARVRT